MFLTQLGRLIQIELLPFAGALLSIVVSRVLHQDPAHDRSSDGAEMRAVLPRRLILNSEFQIGLVYQCCGLKGMIGAFPSKVISGARP